MEDFMEEVASMPNSGEEHFRWWEQLGQGCLCRDRKSIRMPLFSGARVLASVSALQLGSPVLWVQAGFSGLSLLSSAALLICYLELSPPSTFFPANHLLSRQPSHWPTLFLSPGSVHEIHSLAWCPAVVRRVCVSYGTH